MPTSTGSVERRTLVLVLAGVAGSVDAIGYVTLFHLFVAHMTGNTVSAARGAAMGHAHTLAQHGFPIVMFVLGAILGAVFARALHSRVLALVVELIALGLFVLLGSHPRFGELHWLTVAMPALAMGIQAVTIRRSGDATVQTTFVTGQLVSFADALVTWLTSKRKSAAARARLVFAIWCSYVLGAYAGFTAHAHIGNLAAILPLGALAAAVVLAGPRASARGESPARA